MTKKHSQFVKKRFESEFEEYDENIKKIFPFYEEMNFEIIKKIGLVDKQELSMLDLGIGTGETTVKLLNQFPKLRVSGVDLSPGMLGIARGRLEEFGARVKLIEDDIINFKPKQQFDICVAVLSVHHLNQTEKPQLFEKIYNCLKNNGIFIIGDLVTGDSSEKTKQLEGQWEKYLIKKLGKEKAMEWMELYRKEDLPDSINIQLQWLNEAGFRGVECSWHKMNCAVLSGSK